MANDGEHTSTLGREPSLTITNRTTLGEGKRFALDRVTAEVEGGGSLTREIVRHPGAVCVLPILGIGRDSRIVLIRNLRVAAGGWVWEIPAGTLEPGEDPAACAGRELIEEAGYSAATITPIGSFLTTPGLTDERMHAYLATDLKEVGQALEEGEHIRVYSKPVGEVLAMVERGEIEDAKSFATILLALHKGMLGPEGSWSI